MRLTGITQEELNYLFAEYAMRNVTWDYNIGSLLRTRVSSLNPVFVSHPTIIPELVDVQKNWYTISNHLAPQDYGYNIIRLYPEQEQGCSKRIVYVNFEELYIFPDFEEAGLLFGLVAVDENGEPRYSEIYKQDEITFELEDDENELYLVITGAPKNHHNYAWEIGFPKIYRFPYEFRLKNAKPEGFQDGFNAPPVGIPGVPHINGGGFVATTAHVDATAYVGPGALVLDNAQVTGLASIDGNAVIKHNAKVEEAAHVSGTAIIGESARVYGAAQVRGQSRIYGDSKIYGQGLVEGNTHIFSTQVYDSAHLTHNTFCWGAELHGDVKLGGDAEFFRECSDGTYLQFQDAYGRNCDGLDDHPANVDVTEIFNSPKMRNLYKLLCDTLLSNHFEELEFPLCEGDTLYFNGVPITSSHVFEYVATDGADSIVTVTILHYPIPHIIFNPVCPGDTVWYNDTIFLLPGFHYDTMLPNPFFECDIHYEGTIGIVDLDSTVLSIGHSLDVQQPAAYIQWYDCATNLPIAGAHGQTYTPFLSGSYKAYVITIPDSCEFFTGCYDIIGTSTNNPENILSLDIHPNPVSDQLYLQISKSFDVISEVLVMDELGRMHFIKPVRVQPDSHVLDVAFLVPGMYLLNINSGGHQYATRRFVKIQQ